MYSFSYLENALLAIYYQLIIKDTTHEQSKGRNMMHRAKHLGGEVDLQSCCAPSRPTTIPAPCVHQPGSSLNPHKKGDFNGGFLCGHDRWRCCCSVTQSCRTLCNPMDCMQHTRLPCPSLSPGVCSNSCPLSWWCYPTISFSVAPFSSCSQSFPAPGSFAMSRLFTSGGQSIGASTSV